MSTCLKNKHIVLGISGGIAAYKSVELARCLCEQGAEVQVVMTENAKQFIGPLTFQALTHHAVRDDLWDSSAELGMGHIALAKWADGIVIAPATADVLAKLTQGFADNLLLTLCLASKAPIAVVPAMNQNMWDHPATQRNIQSLRTMGISIWGPEEGKQACGDIGLGRMWEPERILFALEKTFSEKLFHGARIVITAGPTEEPIDPVRYVSNRSSGKMGFALARAAYLAGAEVSLITGPTHLETPWGVTRIDVSTQKDMWEAVQSIFENTDIFMSAAAIADYRPEKIWTEKIKKGSTPHAFTFVPTEDILKWVTAHAKKPFTVGFAAETENVKTTAKEKLIQKSLDMIVANEVGPSKGFNQDYQEVTVLWADGALEIPYSPKELVAKQILRLVRERYHARVAA